MNRSIRRALAPAVAVLALAACGGDDEADTTDAPAAETTDAPATGASTEPAPTTSGSTGTTAEPEATDATGTTDATAATDPTTATDGSTVATDTPVDAAPTAPGTELTYGQPAVVPLDEETPDQLIEVTVQPVVAGTAEELAQLQIEDLVGGETIHYVTLDVTNVSAPTTGDFVPNWSFQLGVLQGDGEVAAPIINFIDFAPCDEDEPDELAVGDSFTTCLTYLAAPGATVTAVAFSPGFSTEPITWR